MKPWIAAHYHADTQRQILFGHSVGGMFALYALYKSPESFSVFIAASPELPFSNHIIRKLGPAFEAKPVRRKPRVLVTVGELEGGESPALVEDYRRTIPRVPKAIRERWLTR